MSDRKLIRTLVLYQDPLVAAGLLSALDKQPDVVLVHASDDADVIVADYRRGLQLLDALRGESRAVDARAPRVLILTERDSECEIRHALEQGARGYLTLGCGCDELAGAVRALHRGVRHIGAVAASRLADSIASELLTGRELDVLRLLVEGLPNKAIAKQLNIATGTVKSHMKGIFQKLGARSRTQVAAVAERRGLLSLAERSLDSQAQIRASIVPVPMSMHANRHVEHQAFD